MSRLISRDPFARETLMREKGEKSRCDWCGNQNNHCGTFQYFYETDGGKTNPIRGNFCCVACMRSYNS